MHDGGEGGHAAKKSYRRWERKGSAAQALKKRGRITRIFF